MKLRFFPLPPRRNPPHPRRSLPPKTLLQPHGPPARHADPHLGQCISRRSHHRLLPRPHQYHHHGRHRSLEASTFPHNPQAAAYTLTVRGTNSLQLDDILLGDLWFASGQSNMEMPLSGFGADTQVENADKEIAGADLARRPPPPRREGSPPTIPSKTSRPPLAGPAAPPRPRKTSPLSPTSSPATCNALSRIGSSTSPSASSTPTWGGTPRRSLDQHGYLRLRCPGLMPVFAAHARKDRSRVQQRFRLDAIDKTAPAQKANPPHPIATGTPTRSPWQPAGLYNAMVAPFTPLPIRGVIWYQGETNSALNRVGLYDQLFPALIQDWRSQLGLRATFPSCTSRISAFSSTPKENWGKLRDAQRKTPSSLANTGMAVTIDVGNEHNVQPRQQAGRRRAPLPPGSSHRLRRRPHRLRSSLPPRLPRPQRAARMVRQRRRSSRQRGRPRRLRSRRL